jgi:hypothetical protein
VIRTQKGLFLGRIWWHMLDLRACSWLCFSNIFVFCVIIQYPALAIPFLILLPKTKTIHICSCFSFQFTKTAGIQVKTW